MGKSGCVFILLTFLATAAFSETVLESDFSNLRISYQGTGAAIVNSVPETIIRHHSGDSPLFAVIGQNPLNGGPSLQIDLLGLDAKDAATIKLSNRETGHIITTGSCNSNGFEHGPSCTLNPYGTTFYETKSCSGGSVTGPIPGDYQIEVAYLKGPKRISRIIFQDPCNVNFVTNTGEPSKRGLASISDSGPNLNNRNWTLGLGILIGAIWSLAAQALFRNLKNLQ